MSAQRKLQRQRSRQSKPAASVAKAPSTEYFKASAALRRRVRLVLILTSLGAFFFLHFFREPMAALLDTYGLSARVAFMAILVGPALFTAMVGYARLRDETQSS